MEEINEQVEDKNELLAKRAEELQEQMTNRDKREAVKFFDADFEDFDGLDTMVVLAWVADKSKPLEHYDSLPLIELQKVVLG